MCCTSDEDALRCSDELHAQALDILAVQRARLHDLRVPGDLVLVGGCSLRGALTRGDVDLHLRVASTEFGAAVAQLRRTDVVVHPEIWCPTLATFAVPHSPLPTGMAVTPLGSEHDRRFTRAWALLAADPALLAEYNAVKLAGYQAVEPAGSHAITGAAVGTDSAYEQRKSAFFDQLVEGRPAPRQL